MATPVGTLLDIVPANSLGVNTVLPLIVVLPVSHSVIHEGISTSGESPLSPLKLLDQLNVLKKLIPSTVIGILRLPEEANDVPVFAWIVIVVSFLVNVKPLTVGNVPIVGVNWVVPLYASTSVVVEITALIFPSDSQGNVWASLVKITL